MVSAKNMNGGGGAYRVANSPNYNTEFPDDLEYFDVYSKPIKTLYSQVHWTNHGDIPLPDDIVKRFAAHNNKVMAMVGYEVDQVRTDPDTGDEVSVPITWSYNHHYGAFLYNSQKAQLVKKSISDNPELAHAGYHGTDYVWMVEDITKEENDSPTQPLEHGHTFRPIRSRTVMAEGNGGEMRKSYHGYPKGYAQLIASPDTFSVTPMQIDTWNRESMTNATFVPGAPLPMNASKRINPAEAGYNPLLECPCSDRAVKQWNMSYTVDPNNCQAPIGNATECFQAVFDLIPAIKTSTAIQNSTLLPPGCSASLGSTGLLEAVWNIANNSDDFYKSLDHDIPAASLRDHNKDHDHVVGVARGVVNLTVVLPTANIFGDDDSDTHDDKAVEITIMGPAEKWFGVAFGTSNMCIHMEADNCPEGGPYAIVVMGDAVVERKLEYHGPGTILESTIQVVSNQVDDKTTTRTVKLSRSLKGASTSYYSFESTKATLPVIMATGCSMEFAQHCGHVANQINFVALDTPTAVCRAGIDGTIGGNKFEKTCAPFPKSTLLEEHNPTCNIQDYQGGLSCCIHNHFLLDQDQEIPWSDQPLEFRLKFRFYFQDYQAKRTLQDDNDSGVASAAGDKIDGPSHKDLVRLFWMTEAFAKEYDVPQCRSGTPPSQCVHEITSRWQVGDFPFVHLNGDTEALLLIAAAPHCHAPTCLSMELYNDDTGDLICRMEPIRGQGSNEAYDEYQFLAIPPCLWSQDPESGLPPPVVLFKNTTLFSIKRANSTLPHTGEMAVWQMRAAFVPLDSLDEKPTLVGGRQSNLRSNANAEEREEV